MNKNNKVAKIFTLKQQFPCGPQSSCCGPIGQSEEEVMALKDAIEKLGLEVEVCDVQNVKTLRENPQVSKLLRTFGPQAIPIITVDNEIACMGQGQISDVVSAVRSKL